MATPRQPSFYVNFLRAVRSCEPTTYRSLRTPPATRTQAGARTRRHQSTYQNRYGPAATEALPPPPKPVELLSPQQIEANASRDGDNNQIENKPSSQGKSEQKTSQAKDDTSDEAQVSNQPLPDLTASKPAAEPHLESEVDIKQESLPNRELDMVLSVPSPSEVKDSMPRHPHLEPSPYEHHFDTYSLVQDLGQAQDTFTIKQSTTLMKAIRLMLSNNLDIAKEGLVSKSDVENESYLFRAACSELRTTLQSSRFAENQRQRSNRAQLQHEFDILNQKVSQDMLNMKEELKGMFNDRKMGLQEEKRKIDTKISELNYEITVLLNSEAKSEVESLRWVLTRRAAMAIGVAAFMTLSALQYYSVRSRELVEQEKRKAAAQKAHDEKIKDTESARYTTPSRSNGTQTDGSTTILEESLG